MSAATHRTTTNVVLVHGGFVDGSGGRRSITRSAGKDSG